VQIPDLPEPIVGLKQFHFVVDEVEDPHLRSWNGTRWTAADQRAVCLPPRDEGAVPCEVSPCPPGVKMRPALDKPIRMNGHLGEGCGLYAYKEDHEFNLPEAPLVPDWYSYWQIAGRVLLWGAVYEYEEGYRAEYMRIDGIFLPQANSAFRAAVQRCCEIFGFQQLESQDVYHDHGHFGGTLDG
jgi:hypothetical protein